MHTRPALAVAGLEELAKVEQEQEEAERKRVDAEFERERAEELEREKEEKAAAAAGAPQINIVWQFLGEDGKWKAFEPQASKALEERYLAAPHGSCTGVPLENNVKFNVDFAKNECVNPRTKAVRSLVRSSRACMRACVRDDVIVLVG